MKRRNKENATIHAEFMQALLFFFTCLAFEKNRTKLFVRILNAMTERNETIILVDLKLN